MNETHPNPAPVASSAEQPAANPRRLITYQVTFGRVLWFRSHLIIEARSKSEAIAAAKDYVGEGDIDDMRPGPVLLDHLGIAHVQALWDDRGKILARTEDLGLVLLSRWAIFVLIGGCILWALRAAAR